MPLPNSTISTVAPLLAPAMRPLPLLPLRPLLALIVYRIEKRHSGIFERLGAPAVKRFGIEPTDVPFAFLLEPTPARPAITAVRILPTRLDVRISGPLAGLIGLVDGDFDGDALFFSRDLQYRGRYRGRACAAQCDWRRPDRSRRRGAVAGHAELRGVPNGVSAAVGAGLGGSLTSVKAGRLT